MLTLYQTLVNTKNLKLKAKSLLSYCLQSIAYIKAKGRQKLISGVHLFPFIICY